MNNMQMDMYSMLREQRNADAKPLFVKGQTLYIVSLDTVLTCVVKRLWLCGGNTDTPYFGYSISGDTTSVTWDTEIGRRVFADKSDAELKAGTYDPKNKIGTDSLKLYDICSYEYYRKYDNYRLTAVVGKVDTVGLCKPRAVHMA